MDIRTSVVDFTFRSLLKILSLLNGFHTTVTPLCDRHTNDVTVLAFPLTTPGSAHRTHWQSSIAATNVVASISLQCHTRRVPIGARKRTNNTRVSDTLRDSSDVTWRRSTPPRMLDHTVEHGTTRQ